MTDQDYIFCISDTHKDHVGKTWCGKDDPDEEWTFVSIDHAAMNNRNQGRLLPCADCVAEIVKHLCSTETKQD